MIVPTTSDMRCRCTDDDSARSGTGSERRTTLMWPTDETPWCQWTNVDHRLVYEARHLFPFVCFPLPHSALRFISAKMHRTVAKLTWSYSTEENRAELLRPSDISLRCLRFLRRERFSSRSLRTENEARRWDAVNRLSVSKNSTSVEVFESCRKSLLRDEPSENASLLSFDFERFWFNRATFWKCWLFNQKRQHWRCS